MTTGVAETTYPVMGAIKWQKSFYAQLATPLAVRDLANAMLLFVLVRVAATCGVYFLVMAPFGVFESWWGPPLAWLVTVLVGMSFGTLTFAFSAHVQGPESFGLIFRLGLIPLFLFSGAFFPISNLGTFGEWVARCTPLWHGVNLTRMLCLDTRRVEHRGDQPHRPGRGDRRRLVARDPLAHRRGSPSERAGRRRAPAEHAGGARSATTSSTGGSGSSS